MLQTFGFLEMIRETEPNTIVRPFKQVDKDAANLLGVPGNDDTCGLSRDNCVDERRKGGIRPLRQLFP